MIFDRTVVPHSFQSAIKDHHPTVMKIALGVTGGIAAYKAAEIVRLLQDRGIRVQVVMTRAAQEFVKPLTFAALSGEKVITSMFAPGEEHEPNIDSAIEHIAVAQSIDALLVAPATADVIAHFAQGLATDFLTTLFLATTAPVVVAPAMNVNMWNNPATQANLEILRKRGVKVVEPGSGYLACGMIGAGRLADNDAIVAAVLETLGVFAGPAGRNRAHHRRSNSRKDRSCPLPHESLERSHGLRTRRSSSAPWSARAPGQRTRRRSRHRAAAEVTRVESTDDMRNAVLNLLPQATIVIKTAAVSDYRPKTTAGQKMKRKGPMTLELEATPDILKELSQKKSSQLIIGFAAETENVLENARQKLLSKNLDAIVVNDVSREGVGFDSDRNAVTIITREEVIEVPETTKWEVAQRVLDQVVKLRHPESPQ